MNGFFWNVCDNPKRNIHAQHYYESPPCNLRRSLRANSSAHRTRSHRRGSGPAKPLRALLILGGCCHDYAKQKDILKEGIEARAYVQVDIVYNPDTTTQARFDIYENADWAKGYDVVIHDECSADVKDLPYVQNILAAHKAGVPAVNLHCAMHCYRTGQDDWFRFLGLQSSGHGPQKPISITFTNTSHPIIKGFADWTTINEEHYNNVKIFDTATPLAWVEAEHREKDQRFRGCLGQ